jgi:lipopolysaccharide transport system permease protein
MKNDTFSPSRSGLPPVRLEEKPVAAAIDDGATPRLVLRPASRWEVVDVRELSGSWHVFWAFLWRNIFRRNRQTLLGPLWFVITPLAKMLLFTLALGKIARLPSEGIPYPLFTFAALLPWEFFSTGVMRSSESLVTYEHIITKVYFPRIIIPASEVFGGLLDFAVSLLLLLGMTLAYGFPLTPRLLAIPVFVVLALLLSLAMGLLFSGLHARYRDTSRFLVYLIQFLLYATPVAYSQTVISRRLPGWMLTLYQLNPMYQVVEGMRWSVLSTAHAPDLRMLGIVTLLVLVFLAIGAAVFANTEHSIVDMI